MSAKIELDWPIYVFGQNEYSAILIEHFNVVGVIDEIDNRAIVQGRPNKKLKEINKNEVIVSVVNNSRGFSLYSRLKEDGFNQVVFIGTIINQYPQLFQATYLAQAQQGMHEIDKELDVLRNLFADKQSLIEFNQIVEFRKTLQINNLQNFDVKINEQYFEQFVTEKQFDCLIDGGAYDGHDVEKFIHYYPDYQYLWILEPSLENQTKIHQKLPNLDRAKIVTACLGDQEKLVNFTSSGTAGKITEKGGESVQMITIDSLKAHGKTLVKLDIEGAEVSALKGAMSAINSSDYSFAISAYHLPTDFLDLFLLLNHSKVTRKFYFRHYSNGFAESILYAI